MKKVLLYSGGLDSWLINKLWNPDLRIYINMHTNYSNKELRNIEKQGEPVKIIDFPLNQWELKENKIIPLRNLYLLMVACNSTLFEDVEICLGANIGDRIYDKTLDFAFNAEYLLNQLYKPQTQLPDTKKVVINFAYKNYSKTELLREYLEKGGDIQEAFDNTVSCYRLDNDKSCYSCKNCFRKYLAFKNNGYEFTEEIHKSMFKTFQKEFLPELSSKTLKEYNRGQEGLEFKEYYEEMRKKED